METAEKTTREMKWKELLFVLSQTEGAEYKVPDLPDWSKERALDGLGVAEVPFTMLNGNIQGYAREHTIALNPLAEHPHRTMMHELAHIVLGHTDETTTMDSGRTPRDVREVEAEATAMLVCESLGLAGSEESRAYIQNWQGEHKGNEIPETSARKIFAAADRILKAGRPAAHAEVS